jgi:hypothetical protein
VTGAALLIYFLFGGAAAWIVDRAQMKQRVPYGEFPSFPLERIRITVALFFVLFWFPVLLLMLGYSVCRQVRGFLRFRRTP